MRPNIIFSHLKLLPMSACECNYKNIKLNLSRFPIILFKPSKMILYLCKISTLEHLSLYKHYLLSIYFFFFFAPNMAYQEEAFAEPVTYIHTRTFFRCTLA